MQPQATEDVGDTSESLPEDDLSLPYVGGSEEDFLALLTPPVGVQPCGELKEVSLAGINEVNITVSETKEKG